MLSKLVYASLAATAAAHSIHTRDTERDSGYSAPANSYSAPAPSYSAPAPSYSAPAPSYSAPSPSYAAEASSYDAPAGYGEEAGGGLDLTAIIIPLLALLGLSLLFPTIVTVAATGRRKRSAEIGEETSPVSDIYERVNDIYMSVVESEECMQRIACEVGGLAGDFGFSDSPAAKLADPFVPSKYKAYYKQFKSGQNCHKIKCGQFSL